MFVGFFSYFRSFQFIHQRCGIQTTRTAGIRNGFKMFFTVWNTTFIVKKNQHQARRLPELFAGSPNKQTNDEKAKNNRESQTNQNPLDTHSNEEGFPSFQSFSIQTCPKELLFSSSVENPLVHLLRTNAFSSHFKTRGSSFLAMALKVWVLSKTKP